MLKDRQRFKKKRKNDRKEWIFSADEQAYEQLREDVEEGRHQEMTPSQLQMTQAFYKKYKLSVFKNRIYQMV